MAGVVVRPLWCRLDLGFGRGVIRTTTTGWRQIALFHSLSLRGSSVGGRRTNFVGGRKGRYSPGYRCSTEAEGEKTWGGGVGQQLKWERGGGFVDSLANVHSSAIVEVGAVVHAHAHVGPDTHILSGCIVGPNVNVGSSTTLGYNVVLQNCSVGNSCILHSGVCVGQDGFGFMVNDAGAVVKKPQLLQVQIGNHVEIGANSCIDRGSWRDTVIGDHTKIDNLVQIGHNVVVGRCCMLCGQVGLAGSVTLGDYVVLGGKAGVSDHVSVASKVRVAAKSGVVSNIEEPGDYAGFPAVRAQEWRRSIVALRRFGRPSSQMNTPDLEYRAEDADTKIQ
ncbi:hypothetical protein CY35_08G144000 [Sphagnum magellanicum]|nr:hypothetical protein CY35_08G144000 [Sphagnum magellanicum]